MERQVREVLRRHSQGPLRLFWGFELYHRDDLNFDPLRARGPFTSYTAFRKRLEENSWVRPSSQEDPRFTSEDCAVRWSRACTTLPAVPEVMGTTYNAAADPGDVKDPRAELRWRGGETAAMERVREYIWDQDSLGLDYVGATMTMDPAKSCMRDKAMSKLSPWLAHGCLSPRLLHEEVKRYERERRKTKSTYWITHELVWRDFVRFGSIHAGTSIFKIGGLTDVRPSWRWSTDTAVLKAWCEGRTGFPFVDCFMQELRVTGYCNHMGRECSGWFLIGDLGLDWRMGAEWFESVLIDYEPTANWYNWAYRCLPAASRGGAHGFLLDQPGHRLQGLEILKWGAQHDPDARYIKRWLPELASLPATIAREPWRLDRQSGAGAAKDSDEAGLRPPPTGGFKVSREALQAVLSMGFAESDAAIALYRTWEDREAAVALLLSEAGGGLDTQEEEEIAHALEVSLKDSPGPRHGDAICVDESDEETGELAEAIRLSLAAGDDARLAQDTTRSPLYGGFRYGTDYPRPLIAPVSIRGTEEMEAQARQAQAGRDRQLAATRQRVAGGAVAPTGARESGGTFSQEGREQMRPQHGGEPPTSAGHCTGFAVRAGVAHEGQGLLRHGGQERSQASKPVERKRRWGPKEDLRASDDRGCGG